MSKNFEDLTGRTFGDLTVQKLLENRNGLYYWQCICVCGNNKIASTRRLKAGTCTNCGCKTKAGKDLTGKQFGDLTVIRRTDKKDFWACQCVCGNTKIVSCYALLNGNCRSCGCLVTRVNLKDLTGQKFGKLNVLYRAENDKTNHTRWICQCECGNITTVYKDALISGRQISCGCYNREIMHQRTGDNHAGKKYNKYDLSGEYGIGWTSNTNKEFYFDLEDYEKIKDYCWRESNGYIITNESRKNFKDINKRPPSISLHRLVMNLNNDSNMDVDHIFHKTYDNRKSKLRVVTHCDNLKNHKIFSNNTSGVAGVSYSNKDKNFEAYITVNQNNINLGYYKNFEDAVKARKEAEQKYYGEYAYAEE